MNYANPGDVVQLRATAHIGIVSDIPSPFLGEVIVDMCEKLVFEDGMYSSCSSPVELLRLIAAK